MFSDPVSVYPDFCDVSDGARQRRAVRHGDMVTRALRRGRDGFMARHDDDSHVNTASQQKHAKSIVGNCLLFK